MSINILLFILFSITRGKSFETLWEQNAYLLARITFIQLLSYLQNVKDVHSNISKFITHVKSRLLTTL